MVTDDPDPDPEADADADADVTVDGDPDDIAADALGPDRELLWADLHRHMTGPDAPLDRMDRAVSFAREHLDVAVVLCYPFRWYRKGLDAGIREETVGHDPAYDDWWARVRRVAREHHDPGSFVALPGYEWHGDRTRWGDHNVLFFDDDEHDLRAAETKTELYDYVREAGGLAIPHHMAYAVGHRGADWDVFDPELSPVLEVYSSHGSSEGVDGPVAMAANESMGPRTSGGSFQDALGRGHHVGVVASNDGPGLPGEWGRGIAGLWATGRTRRAVREALSTRRTYGVTGDRIRLWWTLDGHPMGEGVDAAAVGPRTATVDVDCPRPLDRVELLHDEQVVATYTHRDRLDADAPADRTCRVLVELGWGPSPRYGDFETTTANWSGRLRAVDGTIERAIPRFVGFGQRYDLTDDGLSFDLHTDRGETETALPEAGSTGPVQGFVVGVSGPDPTLRLDLDEGGQFSVPIDDARDRTHLFALLDESWDRIEESFDVGRGAVENPDLAYHNARKVKFHRAYADRQCRARVRFEGLPSGGADPDRYYVRAAGTDGQYAWGSPVRVE